jgi:hypothetical protein
MGMPMVVEMLQPLPNSGKTKGFMSLPSELEVSVYQVCASHCLGYDIIVYIKKIRA